MIVLGDSILWGQGLQEPDKMYTQVRNRLAGYLAPWMFLPDPSLVDLHVYAHSGARIVPRTGDPPDPPVSSWSSLWGEAPVGPPSITDQLAKAASDLQGVRTQPCFVLVDGGISDVRLEIILTVDPTIQDKPAWVSKLTQQDIAPDMEQLLQGILAAFPNTFIVVTSYFQIISENSSSSSVVPALSNMLGALNPLWVLLIEPSISSLIQQCAAFDQQSRAGLQQAVATINASLGTQRVFLAAPSFGPQNALGGALPYLWTGTDDPLYGQRSSWWLSNLLSGAPTYTPFASIGHPNVLGERAYTYAVKTQLTRFLRNLGQPQPPTGFHPNEDWTHGPYYGSRGTYFADVDGNGFADAIVVNDDTITVRRSYGSGFNPNENWTHGPYYGSRGTYFADVSGDGRADAIVVNDNTVTVRRSV